MDTHNFGNCPEWVAKAKVKAWDTANIAMLTAFNECWYKIVPSERITARDFNRPIDTSKDDDYFYPALLHSLDVFTEVFKEELIKNVHGYLIKPDTRKLSLGWRKSQDLTLRQGYWASWTCMLAPLGQCIVIDFETTGLDPKDDKIAEIGIVGFGFHGKDPFMVQEFVNPGKNIPKRVTEINGITNEFCKSKPPLEDIIPRLRELFKDSVVIGFNIHKFDLPMLQRQCVELGEEPIEYRYSIDLLSIAQTNRRNKLDNLHQEFCNTLRGKHEALNDCFRCLDILKPILSLYCKRTEMWHRSELSGLQEQNDTIRAFQPETCMPTPPDSQRDRKRMREEHEGTKQE